MRTAKRDLVRLLGLFALVIGTLATGWVPEATAQDDGENPWVESFTFAASPSTIVQGESTTISGTVVIRSAAAPQFPSMGIGIGFDPVSAGLTGFFEALPIDQPIELGDEDVYEYPFSFTVTAAEDAPVGTVTIELYATAEALYNHSMLTSTSTLTIEEAPPDLTDLDGDGYPAEEDCDDTNAAINPAAVEIEDGIDNNCDGSIDEGFDPSEAVVDELIVTAADTTLQPGDTTEITVTARGSMGTGGGTLWLVASWVAGPGLGIYDIQCGDCVYAEPVRYEYAGSGPFEETATFFVRATPGDWWPADVTFGITAEPASTVGSGDTLYDDVTISVGSGNGDGDGDGYEPPADCDDTNAAVYPDADEVDDGVDNDCDGTVDENPTVEQIVATIIRIIQEILSNQAAMQHGTAR